MSTGQFLLCSGVGLMVITIILGLIFWIKKPKYIPGKIVYAAGSDRKTQKFCNGYPTEPLTIHRSFEQPIEPDTEVLHNETERLTGEQTELLSDEEIPQGTEVLKNQQMENLVAETVSSDGTMPLEGPAALPASPTKSPQPDTIPLEHDELVQNYRGY